MKRVGFFASLLYTLIVLASCSSQKHNFFSKTYHNTTAHYNAYFIAKEDIDIVEADIERNHRHDYNSTLQVYPYFDTISTQGVAGEVEDCLKKASLAIQRHPNSKWIDDAYLLVGKGWYYSQEYVKAIETLKFVYTKGEDDIVRQNALLYLMRTYVDYNEINNAISVSDVLKKMDLNKDTKRDYFLGLANIYQKREDDELVAKSLEKGAPMVSEKDGRAKYYFILGQLYQKYGANKKANEYYRKCIRSNPEYEMFFYARLFSAQTKGLTTTKDAKKTRKYFKRLLKDRKNEEFRDKIYYEMGGFEEKQELYTDALRLYKESVKSSVSNPRQKSYSYLKIGQLYFNHFRDYELAKSYYDSTISVMPNDDKQYEEVAERQEILADFVEQLTTIRVQDSLLNLAQMDSAALNNLLDQVIAERKELEKKEEKKARKAQRQSSSFYNTENTFASTSQGSDTWYFYDPSIVANGSNAFVRKWGDRPLEDDWRRSFKAVSATFEESGTERDQGFPEQNDENTTTASTEIDDGGKSAMLASVPFSKEEQAIALQKIEEASFRLGNIYNFDLKEPESAVSTYLGLINRFPESEFKPETLYLLYLLHQDLDSLKAEQFKKDLISEFPNSIFAKLADNPNYIEESSEEEERLKMLYKIAYENYEKGDYDNAKQIVSRGLDLYPDNNFADWLRVLDIMIIGHQEGIFKYQYELQQFIENYPESKLFDYANSLLEASKNMQQEELERKANAYITYFEQEHYIIVTYETKENLTEILPSNIENFIKTHPGKKELNVGNLSLNESLAMVLIRDFESRSEAMEYFTLFSDDKGPLNDIQSSKINTFAISRDNFQILFKSKRVKDYLSFFNEHYQ